MSEWRDKGTGSIRERDGRLQARYSFTDASGQRRQRSSSFDTKTAARKWLTAQVAGVDSGNVSDPGSVTVGEFLTQWLASLDLEAGTVSWYRSAVGRHIIPFLGRTKLSKLTPTMIEAFLLQKARSGHLGGTGKAADKAGTVPLQLARLPFPGNQTHPASTAWDSQGPGRSGPPRRRPP